MEAIGEASRLRDGWDGQGSPAPTRQALEACGRIAVAMMAAGDDPPDRVTVGLSGGMCLEWVVEEAEVHVLSSRSSRDGQ
jgi:hypothetical protein